MTVQEISNLKSEVEEGFIAKNVRCRTVSPLRDGKKRRPSGRNDKFSMEDEVEKPDFGELEAASENRLKKEEGALASNWSTSGFRFNETSGQMPLESRADLIPA